MLAPDVLMRRALTWVRDQHEISDEALRSMQPEHTEHMLALVEAVADDMQHNQLRYFRPFDYQLRFYATGLGVDRRGILAANRIGKTVSTCYETAMHLTGWYPEWWPGRRWTGAVTVFVAGESWAQTALVLQNELLGTSDARSTQDLGTGAIPRANIVTDSIRAEGANIVSVEILHRTGERSRLIFGNYTQEVRNLQGFKIDIGVLDEQPPDDFFSELVTRTATTQGQIMCSFTPLKGLTGLVSRFWNRETGYDFVRVAWRDVPELDPWGEPFLLAATREQLARDYLPHEREARMEGRPIMGQGAVFQMRTWPTYAPTQRDFRTGEYHRVIALDLGLVRDSTVITLMYWHPGLRQAWLHRQIRVTGLEEANPTNYVQHLMRPEVFGCPIVLPPDASTPGRYTMSAASIRDLFEEYGLNVVPRPVANPADSQGRVTNHKSYGINVMRQMLEAGTLEISDTCQTFIREAENYHVDPQGRFSDPDDHIDSARYALLACLNGWAEPDDGRSPDARRQEWRDRMAAARQRATVSRQPWKQAWDPGG